MATPKEQVDGPPILGWRPHLARSALVEILHSLFYSADRIRDPNLEGFVWSSTASSSGLAIKTHGHLSLKNVNMMGKLVVQVGPSSIPDIQQKGDKMKQRGTVETRAFLLQTAFTIQCVGTSEILSLELGGEVLVRLRENASVFEKYYNLHEFSVKGMDAPKKIDEKSWATPISLAIRSQHASATDTDDICALFT